VAPTDREHAGAKNDAATGAVPASAAGRRAGKVIVAGIGS
jgi:hypothetical protein